MHEQTNQYQLTFVVDRKPRWPAVTTSFVVQAIGVMLLIQFGIINPKQLVNAGRHYSVVDLSLDVPTARPQPSRQVLRKAPAPRPDLDRYFETATLRAPARVRIAPVAREEAPQIQLPNKQAELASLPQRPISKPAPIVQTGAFSAGSSAQPTVNNVAANKVQTGGFGDPNGIKGIGKGDAKLVAAAVGSFDLPGGPANGNGTGGRRGVRGTIASAGFGNGVATSNPGNVAGETISRGAIQQAGFGDSRPADQPRLARASTPKAEPHVVPVQILSKPTPLYTDEARAMRLEGDVVLEVLFTAAGQAQVSRIVQGLGHGLDQAATRAVAQIKYRPAKRDGQAVDSTSIIHVVFQLAY